MLELFVAWLVFFRLCFKEIDFILFSRHFFLSQRTRNVEKMKFHQTVLLEALLEEKKERK